MIRALIDPGVLIAASISPKGTPASLLQAWYGGAFELIVCPVLISELRRAFAYPKVLRRVALEEAASLIRALQAGAVQLQDPIEVPAVCRDPADDYLFTLAADARAILISGDSQVLAVTGTGVRVVSPSSFARLIEEAAT